MPVRRLKKNYCNATGLFYSRKLSKQVQCDSMLERDFALLLDLHPAVSSFEEQPIRITWIDTAGDRQAYVPDFYIAFSGSTFLGRRTSRPWLVETKYRSELTEKWPSIEPKLRAGFSEARYRGCIFHVITEDVLQSVPFKNAQFLRRYVNSAADSDLDRAVVEQARLRRRTTPEGIATALTQTHSQRDECIQSVWTAVAQGHLAATLEEPLSVQSSIWIASQK